MPQELDSDTLAFAHRMFDLARSGATATLATYVKEGLPLNLTNDSGDTLLILAAYHDHPETVKELLRLGAETDRVNDRGQTALGAAVFRKSEESVRALLAAGAEADEGSPSAVEVAHFFDLPEMLALLTEEGPG